MKLLAIGLGIIASCLVVSGICLEAITGGELGYILISVGSVAIVAGSAIYAKKFIKEP